MLQQMKKQMKNEKGLTLIELLAVIVILAIIAAIAIPAIGNIVQKSDDKAVLSEALNIISGAKIAHTNGACSAANVCDKAVLDEYVDGVSLPDGTQVALVGNDWTITYSTLDTIETEDLKLASPATEAAIKEKLR